MQVILRVVIETGTDSTLKSALIASRIMKEIPLITSADNEDIWDDINDIDPDVEGDVFVTVVEA